MLKALPILDFIQAEGPVLDVRSPGEFLRAHIPGAHSLPLFTDEERARVGTIYKQQGRDAAVLEGLRAVGPRMATLVEQARELAPNGRIRVHCWRGGERSGSVAWLLNKAGFSQVTTLIGGYKAFRTHVLGAFNGPWNLNLLGGFTGTGKTELLGMLQQEGEQMIDLEALACHKGSSFGALGQQPQPTTEHFENLLWHALSRMDPSKPIWLEDESLMIGRVRLPDQFFLQMRQAPFVFIEMPQEQRAARLVKEYGDFHRTDLAAAISRIARRLGPQHAKSALEALDSGDIFMVALITLRYYDKAYLRGAMERDPVHTIRIPLNKEELPLFTKRLKEHAATRSE